MPMWKAVARVAPAAFLAVLALGCGAPSDGGGPGAAAGSGSPPEEGSSALEGALLVSAASSLTDAFADLGSAFEAAHPGVEVTLNLAGSRTLATQILEGAPADVFASADPVHMDRLAEAGALGGPAHVFARNRLEVAVPSGNPGKVAGLADFARPELLLGLCAPGVPCGDLAREALERAGVRPAPDTEEPNVRALLTKVELGELDAALTYATDVAAADGSVEGIPIPAEANVVAAYPIAVLAAAPNPEVARAFVALVLSREGRALLARYGFAAP